jgi:gliding motility-associated-like protein
VKTVYKLLAVDSNGCHVSDSITVAPISKIFVPNAFTPDGDGINDLFRIRGHNLSDYSIRIYDRWGREVYRSTDITSGWNGKKHNNGKDVPIGTYTYTIRYTVKPDQERYETGAVNLIR